MTQGSQKLRFGLWYDFRNPSQWRQSSDRLYRKNVRGGADHTIYQANNYSAWLSAAGLQPLAAHLGDREQLRQSGLLNVVDPDTAISMIRNFAENVPITHFYSWTLPPGLPPRWAQTHLELFASKVIPAFR